MKNKVYTSTLAANIATLAEAERKDFEIKVMQKLILDQSLEIEQLKQQLCARQQEPMIIVGVDLTSKSGYSPLQPMWA